MFDTHLHTKFSTDSKMEITDAITSARNLDLGLVITEHMDPGFPNPEHNTFNINDYFNEYSNYRSDKLLLGVELGMRPDLLKDVKEIATSYPFDQIIGSVHVVDGIDAYAKSYYEGRTKKQCYDQYLRYMLDCVQTHDFIDTLGHIDYIARYNDLEDKEIYYNEYSEYIDEILIILAKNEKAIEINGVRLGNEEAVKNMIRIYKRFSELGGKYVTVGSDAHSADRIGRNFGKAKEIAENCGLKIVYFRERSKQYV